MACFWGNLVNAKEACPMFAGWQPVDRIVNEGDYFSLNLYILALPKVGSNRVFWLDFEGVNITPNDFSNYYFGNPAPYKIVHPDSPSYDENTVLSTGFIYARADTTTEGAEYFVVHVRRDNNGAMGEILETSESFTINDTSLSP